MTGYCQSDSGCKRVESCPCAVLRRAGFEQMQQFASMLEMMKKKMGKKCLAQIGVMNAQSIGAITQMFETSHGPCHRRGRFVRYPTPPTLFRLPLPLTTGC
jgi:hypothetical protein